MADQQVTWKQETIELATHHIEAAIDQIDIALDQEPQDGNEIAFYNPFAQELDAAKTTLYETVKKLKRMYGVFKPSLNPNAIEPDAFLMEPEDI